MNAKTRATEIATLLSSKVILESVSIEDEISLSLALKELSNLANMFLDGSFHIMFNHLNSIDTESGIFNEVPSNTLQSWEKKLELSVTNYFNNAPEDDLKVRHSTILLYGASALQLYIQNNWTGPVTSDAFQLPLFTKENEASVIEALSSHGPIYNLTRRPEFLLFSKTLLALVDEEHCPTKIWWQFRYNRIFQYLLPERISALYYNTIDLIEKGLTRLSDHVGDTEKALLLTEASLYCTKFRDISRSKNYLQSATSILGVDISMTGALAKRTRFQQTPYAQLVVKINHDRNSKELFDMHDESIMPVDVKLQDEALLHNIAFLNVEDNEIERIEPEELAIVLATCVQKRKCAAHDDMLKEELIAFIECILSRPNMWSFHFNALLLRSLLEKNRMKKVERAMMQVQALVDLVNKESEDSMPRLQLFYCTLIPPFWSLEKQLAELFMSLGSIKSALDIFLRLQLWEDVVFCYKRLQQNEKALKIIRDQMQIKETPLLYCLLGDVTNDPECYEKAWELSKHRSGRSQRSLGYYYFDQKKFSECVPYFAKAVEISSLDQKVWFSYGHAATQLEDYELATKCYRWLINLDPDSYEAWNNLSNAYIKMKQKPRAWKTLQEALKCNFEEWRIWENYLLVSMDVGAFEDVIKAWHRLIELRGKHVDEEILELLVNAIINDVIDINQRPASSYRQKALELLGHITATATNSGKTWYLYGKLLDSNEDALTNPEVMDRVVQYYQKAYRNSILKEGWDKSPKLVLETISYAETISDAILRRITLTTDENQVTQMKQSVKLMLKSVIAIVTKQLEDYMYGDDANDILIKKDNLVNLLENV